MYMYMYMYISNIYICIYMNIYIYEYIYIYAYIETLETSPARAPPEDVRSMSMVEQDLEELQEIGAARNPWRQRP